MERIKFEENSREKLEERELQPSAGAWNKLEAMLEEEQPSKKGGGFKWLAIAASFIGFVIIASIYFNQNDKNDSLVIEEITPEILKEDQKNAPFKTVEEINKENETVAETLNETPTIENEIIDVTSSKLKEKENRITKVTTQNAQERNTTSNISNNANQLQKTQQVKNNALKNLNNTPIINTGQISAVPNDKLDEDKKDGKTKISENKNPAIDAVVAKIKDIKNQKGTVTEAEINSLLASAQQDLKLERLLDSSSGKVDAMALLGEVEMELEQTFREKVFYALGEGFEQLRTTISDRNN